MANKMILGMLLFCLFMISVNTSAPTNITVNPGSSIQSAVNEAHSGDTIIVNDNNKQPYTYKESITLNKKLNIISNGLVTIKAKNTNSAVLTINPNAAGSSIKNFKLSDTSYCIMVNWASRCNISGNTITASLVGIQFYGNVTQSHVSNNKISGETYKKGNGISFEYGKSTYNSIYKNTICNFLNGILFNDYSRYNTVSSNNVRCYGLHGAGIYFTDNSQHNKIIQNTVSGAVDGIAIQSIGNGIAKYFTITGNNVKYNINGLWVKLTQSTISYNKANSNMVSGLDITGSKILVTHNWASYNKKSAITLGRFSNNDQNTIMYNILTYNKAAINTKSQNTIISRNTIQHNYYTIV